ncbi:L-fucose:H+ symporter permease [Gilvimarinus sp. SDUM040013]|uniref:L-fucose:H+ symporter permease n=1 Tax=Gilvimarinus gilvus TaxID=3058038 RepID=A0ABU4S6W4_9GAMM|nr:L-fucose:H+ symporter permease [Gilvimarinus sp. SDUM040013]MDO3384945.1 L-fucose:H+ symporter permease [Gilvimarinus sp. SDUM040013]MDX6851259.1 L-fucose:H+ symporter permease [Gilvimarinus sp. SDUM040013]
MSNSQSSSRPALIWVALLLIVSLFFMWGVANNLNDILITQFKKAFVLSDLQSGLVQSAFYFGYFVFAIPAALAMKRFGYKAAVIVGLLLYAVGAGLFYPAALAHEYVFFLAALFIIASGLSFLETSANPLIVALGDPATAERRLNFAQSFNSLGTISGVLIGREFILSGVEHSPDELAAMSAAEQTAFYTSEVQAVAGPYLAIAAVVLCWALAVALVKFPVLASKHTDSDETFRLADFKALFNQRYYMFGVLAQFFYVGAQVCIWSFMIRYGQEAMPGAGEKSLATYLTLSLVAFMVGRFFSTWLMGYVNPARLMGWYALINILLCGYAVVAANHSGLIALASTSFFMSLMFPTIFALSIKGLGGLAKTGSSLLIMAIIGGAIITAIMGLVSDLTSMHTAVVVPLLCFGVVGLFAKRSLSEGGHE